MQNYFYGSYYDIGVQGSFYVIRVSFEKLKSNYNYTWVKDAREGYVNEVMQSYFYVSYHVIGVQVSFIQVSYIYKLGSKMQEGVPSNVYEVKGHVDVYLCDLL